MKTTFNLHLFRNHHFLAILSLICPSNLFLELLPKHLWLARFCLGLFSSLGCLEHFLDVLQPTPIHRTYEFTIPWFPTIDSSESSRPPRYSKRIPGTSTFEANPGEILHPGLQILHNKKTNIYIYIHMSLVRLHLTAI